jgi:hypothetical protein
MKKSMAIVTALFLGTLLSLHAEDPIPADNNKVAWHSITMIDFKPGTLDDVKTLILKFESASLTAGIDVPELYWFKSGKYDLILTWKLKEGKADFQGKWSPYGESWWNALVEQEGSEEAASQLQTDYNNLVDTSVTTVARKAL